MQLVDEGIHMFAQVGALDRILMRRPDQDAVDESRDRGFDAVSDSAQYGSCHLISRGVIQLAMG